MYQEPGGPDPRPSRDVGVLLGWGAMSNWEPIPSLLLSVTVAMQPPAPLLYLPAHRHMRKFWNPVGYTLFGYE